MIDIGFGVRGNVGVVGPIYIPELVAVTAVRGVER